MNYNVLVFRVIPEVRKEIFAHAVDGKVVTYTTKRNAENEADHLAAHYRKLGGLITLEVVKEAKRRRIFSHTK